MINLTEKQKILNLHLQGVSNRKIANQLGKSKDTINKYVKDYNEKRQELLGTSPDINQSEIIQDFCDKPKYNTKSRKSQKVTPEVIEIIEDCLKRNEAKRIRGMAKQQMKKIDIYEYLIQKGFDISYSTVKLAVTGVSARHAEAFIRQEYRPGIICEFDWGTVKIDIGNGIESFQMAVFTAANSNYRFAKLYKSQDTAAFQEAHADFFKHCRGTYHEMVYDNMKVAVKRFVGFTEKEPTKALTELSIYYGFNYRFCNIASGNEKGHVERSVEFIRRKVFSGPGNDHFNSLSDANMFLINGCMKLNSHRISKGTIPLEQFKIEKQELLPALPVFESCIKTIGRVDKYSIVVIRQNHYSVPDLFVNKHVDIRTYTDKIVIYFESKIIATHERSFSPHDWTIDIYHYLRTLKKKPGALHQSTALLQMDTQIKYIFDTYYTKDSKTFLEVLELISKKGVFPVSSALRKLEILSPLDMSIDKVKLLCDQMAENLSNPIKIGTDHLSLKAKNTLTQYDRLREIQHKQESVAI